MKERDKPSFVNWSPDPQLSTSRAHYDHDYGLPEPQKRDETVQHRFNLLTSPMHEFIDPISSTTEGSDWVMRCICQNNEEIGDLICCDNCNMWQHIECLKLDPKNLPEKFFCTWCQAKIKYQRPQQHFVESRKTPTFDRASKKELESAFTKVPVIYSSTESLSSQASSKRRKNTKMSKESPIRSRSCDCSFRIFSMLGSSDLALPYSRPRPRSRSCHSFTLKNGQKILKSSKLIQKDVAICEVKGDLHLLEYCQLSLHNYNCFSSFIYTLPMADGSTLALDARTSTHFSRYIRRSCVPNTKLSCTVDYDTKIIKILLYSLQNIDNHTELTISVDRTQEFFEHFETSSSKHHWHKYDYSSALICNCDLKELTFEHDEPQNSLCSVSSTKKALKSMKGSRKRLPKDEMSSESPPEASSSGSDAVDAAKSSLPAQNARGLSREQKKINYWLKVIDDMEKKTTNQSSRHRRKEKPEEALSEKHTSPPSEPIPSLQDPSKTLTFQTSAPLEHLKQADELPKGGTEEQSWLFSPELTTLLIKNRHVVKRMSEQLSESCSLGAKRTQVPPKLALRRGLYHLVPPHIVSEYRKNIYKNCPFMESAVQPRKRSFSEKDAEETGKVLPDAPDRKSPETTVTKSEPPIPQLRPTLPRPVVNFSRPPIDHKLLPDSDV